MTQSLSLTERAAATRRAEYVTAAQLLADLAALANEAVKIADHPAALGYASAIGAALYDVRRLAQHYLTESL